jgi:hypothetical protein
MNGLRKNMIKKIRHYIAQNVSQPHGTEVIHRLQWVHTVNSFIKEII